MILSLREQLSMTLYSADSLTAPCCISKVWDADQNRNRESMEKSTKGFLKTTLPEKCQYTVSDALPNQKRQKRSISNMKSPFSGTVTQKCCLILNFT